MRACTANTYSSWIAVYEVIFRHTWSHANEWILQIGLDSHYLVKWRLDSCTSISLLLKSLSSLRIAACKGQKKRKIEREKQQRLSTQTAASKPGLYLLLACFMHHLRSSGSHEWFCWILFSHHKNLQFPSLETSKSINNNIQSFAGLLG